jgi:hypothetical protein
MTKAGTNVHWRATGPYLPTNASKAGLVEETRQFLLTYNAVKNVTIAAEELVSGLLPQRSRTTRQVIVRVVKQRLVNWRPPQWVLDDLAGFAQSSDELRAALLLHVVRQDRLLYDFVQEALLPRWRQGTREVTRSDVQGFLDQKVPQHPEIDRWSHETREKLTGNMLSILRDYGLLSGTARKHIVEPAVPTSVTRHLVRLLVEEGVSQHNLLDHEDWHIWLWDSARVRDVLAPETSESVHKVSA